MYDLTVITVDEAGVEKVIQHIKDHKGEIKQQKSLGVKPFAYPIDKKLEGLYTALLIDLAADQINLLNHELTLDTAVVRHLTLKTDATEILKPAEPTSEVPAHVKTEKPAEVETAPAEVKDREVEAPAKTEEKAKAKAEPKPKKETKKEKDEREKALNEKLDQILSE